MQTKYKFRLVPCPEKLAYVLQGKTFDPTYYPAFPDGTWSSWWEVKRDYTSEPYYFASRETAEDFLRDYKEWLTKESIELEG